MARQVPEGIAGKTALQKLWGAIILKIQNLKTSDIENDGDGTSAFVTENDLTTAVTNINATTGLKEDKANKVNVWSTTVNNTHYPSEKLVKDSLDGKVDDFTLDLYTGSAGNPRPVKFLTVNYAGTDSNNAVFVTLSAMSCHPNGSSYKFAEDITIGVTYTGGVGVDVQQSIRQSCGNIDGAEHFYGDVFYVVNTSTTTVDFYIYCGQWAHTKFTPYKRRNGAAGGTITQYNGTATYYSSGTKVYGNNDLITTKGMIPTESTVSGWGFTKNTGTYSKPSTGIPKTDLATAVQTSLDKADSALQNHQSASTINGASIGSATKGTYINASGKPTAMTYSLNKDVPSDAVFTDTHYTAALNIQGNGTTATSFAQSAAKTLNFVGSGATSVSATTDKITILSTDTKNTAGSTDTSSKIFLVGATSQAANPQTYSDNQIYATNGQLNGNSIRIAEAVNLVYDGTNKCLNFNFV